MKLINGIEILTNNCYNIGEHVVFADFVQSGQMGETGRLDFAAVGPRRTVRNEIHAKLALQ